MSCFLTFIFTLKRIPALQNRLCSTSCSFSSFSSLDLAALIASWGWGGRRSIWQYSISRFSFFRRLFPLFKKKKGRNAAQDESPLCPLFCNSKLMHHAQACPLEGAWGGLRRVTFKDELILSFKQFLWRKMKTRKKMEKWKCQMDLTGCQSITVTGRVTNARILNIKTQQKKLISSLLHFFD